MGSEVTHESLPPAAWSRAAYDDRGIALTDVAPLLGLSPLSLVMLTLWLSFFNTG